MTTERIRSAARQSRARSVGRSFVSRHRLPTTPMIWGFGFLPRRESYAWWFIVCTQFLSRREYISLCPTSWETISFQIGLTCPANRSIIARSEGVATLDVGNMQGVAENSLGPRISTSRTKHFSYDLPGRFFLSMSLDQQNEAHSSGFRRNVQKL
jgi:hypothetical protein